MALIFGAGTAAATDYTISSAYGLIQLNNGDTLSVSSSGTVAASTTQADANGVWSTGNGSISNSGTISALGPNGFALNLYLPALSSLTNASGATITGTTFGINAYQGSINGDLNNAGTISGLTGYALNLYGTAITGTLSNSGSIAGANAAIYLDTGSSVAALNNTTSGSISSSNGDGITFHAATMSGILNNSGSITGGNQGLGVDASSQLANITNSGTISGGTSGAGIAIASGAGIDSSAISGFAVNNTGTIQGGSAAIDNAGTIQGATHAAINNLDSGSTAPGLIQGTSAGSSGILNETGGIIAGSMSVYNRYDGASAVISGDGAGITNFGQMAPIYSYGGSILGTNTLLSSGLVNSGTISSIYNEQSYGVSSVISGASAGIDNNGTITTISNDGGSIAASAVSGIGLLNRANGTIGSLQLNFGTDSGTQVQALLQGPAVGLENLGQISVVQLNSSLISGATGVLNAAGASITSLALNTNATDQGLPVLSAITGSTTGIDNAGSIGTISNFGSIGGGIVNNGSIVTLRNAQGGSTAALQLQGNLPQNYAIVIGSGADYGQLAYTNPSSAVQSMLVSIDPSSTAPSQATTYQSVLSGVAASNLALPMNPSFAGYTYNLIDTTPGSTNIWNLQLIGASGGSQSNMGLGSTTLLSGLGSSNAQVFDGGTLQLDNSGLVSQSFAITGNGGVIDINGQTLSLGGTVSDSGSGGLLRIVNSGQGGSLSLSGSNSYSGGTEVDAGATLQIGSAAAMGSGSLALVGSSSVPATLRTTATLDLSNPISVSGDPVFDVASGTTTTISSPITDGSSAGELVLNSDGSSSGTLVLSGNNTYTGVTTIQAGTLALSGSGSIASSSAVTNQGTFDISAAAAPIHLNQYSQTSNGTLIMQMPPSGAQLLSVNGTASLAGALDLLGASGTYSAGRYTLLSANAGISGSFASLVFSGASLPGLNYALSYDANNVYLMLLPPGPSAGDTNASSAVLATALQVPFVLQTAALNADLGTDCSAFDQRNLCLGTAGQFTQIDNLGPHTSAALLYGALRLNPHLRIGAWVDQGQSLQMHTASIGGATSNPLLGVWGVWSEHPGAAGFRLRLAAGYGDQRLNLTRSAIGSAEPGAGSSWLNAQGTSVEISDDQPLARGWLLSPFAGLRVTRTTLAAYTEASSSAVTDPLHVGSLRSTITTATLGARIAIAAKPGVGLHAVIGVEQDLGVSGGSATVSSANLGSLDPLRLDMSRNRTRPMLGFGASVDLGHAQRLGLDLSLTQQAFSPANVEGARISYSAGF